MDKNIHEADARDLAVEYYTEYARYVLEYRALPGIYDGLKPVQRRVIYCAYNQPGNKMIKTAKLSGSTLQYHPHSSDSVDGAINNMAHPDNVLKVFDTQGNFGSVSAGPSASRYTEVKLSEVGRLNFCQFMDYVDYEEGEIGEQEPSYLASLIPYCLVAGSEGIGIGLSTKIMPLNLLDLIDYYIDWIKNDGKSDKKIKPDVGYVSIDSEDLESNVKSYRGSIVTSSIPEKISDNSIMVEGIHSKSIDAMINKIDRWKGWFSKDQVGFRDASATYAKYIFEIYDTKNVSIEDLKNDIYWASRGKSTYTRVVEDNGNAIYSSLDHVVSASLKYLNKSIDNKLSTEKIRYEKQLVMYNVLDLCKSKGVFEDISKLTSDELISRIIKCSGCNEEVAKEIIRRPISYLTRSHKEESESIKEKIKNIETHNRKEYLISLYEELRDAVMKDYDSMKHSILDTDQMIKPKASIKNGKCVLMNNSKDGVEYESTLYFVSDKGYIYPRNASMTQAGEFPVDTYKGDKIVGVASDKCKFIRIDTRFTDSDKWEGHLTVSRDSVRYDRRVANLDDNEYISAVAGTDSDDYLRTKLSKTIKNKIR